MYNIFHRITVLLSDMHDSGDSSVNWFDALLQLQLTVVTASTVSFSGVPQNETASKFLTYNSDIPIYTTATLYCFL